MKERRRHGRVIINKQAWICNFDENSSPTNLKDCQILDISEGGACIQCSSSYKEGQALAFTYQDFIVDGLRPVIGVVMWSKQYSETSFRYGLKFLGLSTQMLCKIQDQVILAAGARRPEDQKPPQG